MNRFKINWQQTATEFVVIVVGVLAALAVDQWRSERDDRKTEAEYITRLRIDVEADIENFYRFERILEGKAHFLQSLLDDTIDSVFADDTRGLMEAKEYSSYRALPDSVSTTFDELQSTGRLALIQDLAQRDALSKYYSGFEHISVILSEPFGNYRRLMAETIPASITREWRLSDNISKSDEFRQSLKQLQASPDARAAINSEIVYATSMQFYLSKFRNQAENLQRLLDQE